MDTANIRTCVTCGKVKSTECFTGSPGRADKLKPSCKSCEADAREYLITHDDGSLLAKLMRHINKDPSGCWLWTGGTSPKGYGNFHVKGWPVRANRAAYCLMVGPIADGLWVLHSCDTPRCCNPAHLRLGTHADNVADKVSRNRQSHPIGALHPLHKLDVPAVTDIRRNATVAREILARKYGVSQRTISDVRERRSWKHVA